MKKNRKKNRGLVYSSLKGRLPFDFAKVLTNLRNLIDYEVHVQRNMSVMDIARKSGLASSSVYHFIEGRGTGRNQFLTVFVLLQAIGIYGQVLDVSALNRPHSTNRQPRLRLVKGAKKAA